MLLSDVPHLLLVTVLVVQGRGALQDIDQMSLFKPLCKFCASIRTVREIVPTVRKALAVAQSGTPGPVFIEFPIDTLYPFHLVSKEFGVKNPPKGLMGRIVSWYVFHMYMLHILVLDYISDLLSQRFSNKPPTRRRVGLR